MNLFLFREHFYLIKNFHRFLCHKQSWQRKFCERCLSGFRDNVSLQKHSAHCLKAKALVLPKKGTSQEICEFKEYSKTERYPYVVYADFETIAETTNHAVRNTIEYQEHKPVSYGYVIVNWEQKIVHKEFYCGLDCIEKFLLSMKSVYGTLQSEPDQNIKPIRMTDHDEECFQQATSCIICFKSLSRQDAVRDHDHLTGAFRGAAHRKCNFAREVPRKLPIFFHNPQETVTPTLFARDLRQI